MIALTVTEIAIGMQDLISPVVPSEVQSARRQALYAYSTLNACLLFL